MERVAEAVPPASARSPASPADPPPFLADVWTAIAANLDVQSLGRLARVGRSFPAPVEEGARLALAQRPEHERQRVDPREGSRALRLLYDADVLSGPLRFTLHGPDVALRADGEIAAHGGGWQAAVCRRPGGVEMVVGRHFFEAVLHEQGGLGEDGQITHAQGDIGCWVGVVGAAFDPSAAGSAEGSAVGADQGSFAVATAAIHDPTSHLLYTQDCQLFRKVSGVRVASQGDAIGLLLDASPQAMLVRYGLYFIDSRLLVTSAWRRQRWQIRLTHSVS